ncbi:low molecular weight protein tyrosine phosphatase family protein [Microbulbifer sp. PAAF003]|uniref:low molecular weight protein tyrosine phosphatase family protein n=1 Tax=Microbulbifer sp. PAAF003 TaxID=3243375 RepID=UPI004039886B
MDDLRSRAARRSKTKAKPHKNSARTKKPWISEKNWKLMYTRSEKLRRAKQLGIEYPRRTMLQILNTELPEKDLDMRNLLFICSRNQWRSPTAEAIWRKHPDFNAKSAGTSPRAKKTVRSADIRWADVIFVMEQKHKNRLIAEFSRMLDHKPVHVLDIPDEYKYMDPELVQELESVVRAYLES